MRLPKSRMPSHKILLLPLALLLVTLPLGLGDKVDPEDGTEVIEEEPNGPIDFSTAERQPDGSMCVTKTKYVQKMEKTQVKECWHQNVTACHETYVTEFRPNQERECEENFWKACKISFRERSFNYTLRTCMTPLVKKCDEDPSYGNYSPPQARRQPEMVCKTWFESTCNTTYSENGEIPKPQTWCTKEPKKICAPDNCRMEPGEQVCHDKNLESTVQKPEEVCDLQPQTHCRLVTNLVPHLESQTVCKEVPKEICHLKLDHPKMVRKPVKLKWCTRPPAEAPAKQGYYGAPTQGYAQYAAPEATTEAPRKYAYRPYEEQQEEPERTTPPPPSYPPPSYGYQAQPSPNAIPRQQQQPQYPSYPQPATDAPKPTASPVYYKPSGGGGGGYGGYGYRV